MAKIETDRTIKITVSRAFRRELMEIWQGIKDFSLEDSAYDIFDAIDNGATEAWVYDGTLVINYADSAEEE